MSICPSCRKPVDSRLSRCPWDGTLLGTVTMDPLLGTALGGRYLLRKCIGERERMLLYNAEDLTAGRPALATVFAPRDVDEAVLARFQALAESARRVAHPGCTAVRDHGRTADGRLFVVEDSEVWHQLGQELVLKERLPASKALDLSIQLVEALDHLHAKGIFRVGFSTPGLRLAFDGQGALKLLIPMAEVVAHALDTTETRVDAAAGLEQDLDRVSRVLAEMLTGRPDAAEALATFDWKGLGLDDDLGRGLRMVIERGLGRTGQRYGSAWEMRRELESLTGQSRFGRYDLLHRLAVGGMGEIYLARAVGIEGLDINRLCVIKTIRTNLMQSGEFVERFLAEARVVASLSHGNIVPVYDVGKVGSIFYIAMEYVAGKDLRKILTRGAKEHQRLSVPLALFVAKELANGLAYAHRAKVQGSGGLVHRDVSPHNTLVSYEGEVKLIDFGLAKGAAELATVSKEGVVMGKVCYLSPEQARAEPLDQRTDIYSAGLVLFELLTGEPFFNQPTTEEVLEHVANPLPEPPSARAPEVPPEVDRICLRAMARRPDDRYRTAAALRDDLTAELARLAPRTNPEEVAAYVRELFATEQKDEESLLSDLSLTMPPDSDAPADSAPDDPRVQGSGGQAALSLLGRTPQPIHLGATIVGPMDDALQSPALALAPTAPATPRPGAKTPPVDASDAPLHIVPTLEQWGEPTLDVFPTLRPMPVWRQPVVLLLGVLIVAAGGVLFGLWLSREKAREVQEAERAAFRALFQRTPIRSPRRSGVDGGLPADAAGRTRVDGRRRDPRVNVLAHKVHVGTPRHAPAAPAPCLLSVKGAGVEGVELVIDGRRIAERLPLPGPLALAPGRPHHIAARRAGFQAFQTTLTCESGEALTIRLKLRPE